MISGAGAPPAPCPSAGGRYEPDLDAFCMRPSGTIREALEAIARGGKGIVLLTRPDRQLLGTVTDGDIRRAILAGLELDGPLDALIPNSSPLSGPAPVTAPEDAPRGQLLHTMHRMRVRHLPLLGADGSVVDLVTLDELVSDPEPPIRALVMAGGYGRRLLPLTERQPKPMLQVGDRPILEHTIVALREVGIQQVTISTHYLAQNILDHFGDGGQLGVELRYITEDEPLGTAGSLRRLPKGTDPILVVNGDIVTSVDYRAMVQFHRDHDSLLTLAVRPYRFEVPYGVVTVRSARVRSLLEKPRYDFMVNAGIYVLEPRAIDSIPDGARSDMTDLIATLLRRRETVTSFPVLEQWIDVGRPLDLARACEEHGAQSRPPVRGAPDKSLQTDC